MQSEAVLELLSYYQRDLRDSPNAAKALKGLEIVSPEVIEHFGLGWCSGNALHAASHDQIETYKRLRLVVRGQEILKGCIIMPVYDNANNLVDLVGIRQYQSKGNDKRYLNWQQHSQGLIGSSCLPVYPEVFLADSPYLALHLRQYGYLNIIAIRNPDEISQHLNLLQQSGIKRMILCSRKCAKPISATLATVGIEVVVVSCPSGQKVPTKEALEQAATSRIPHTTPAVKLIARTDNRLHFIANEVVFRIESTAAVGLGMKCQLKVEKGNTKLIDKLDFSSAQNRTRFAKLAASRLRMSGYELEECLNTIADQLDTLLLDDAQAHTRLPKVLTATEEAEAHKLLKRHDLLTVMADALTNSYGIVG